MNIKPNIFSFATSELSQDAFICWLVSHINHSEKTILHECAKDFIAELYNLKNCSLKINKNNIGQLETEPKQQYCKTDVYFQVYINGKVVSFIIEDKTHTSHHSDQLRKYRDGISKDKDAEDEIFCIYFKTGYMFPDEKKEVEDNGYSIFDYKKMNEFLQNYTTDNLIFDSYKEYIKEKYFDLYEQNKNRWKDGYYSCFEYGFAQCEYLLNLSEKCKETIPPGKVHIYGGSNRSGSSWTQLKFIEIADVYCEEVNEYVFYRLDKRDSKYYLSVRQYANIKDKNSEEAINLKLERLDRYQEIFKQAINKGNLKFRDKLSNRGVNESEIAVLFFDENENTPNNVLEEMKSIHAAFVEGIKNRQLGTITPSIKR